MEWLVNRLLVIVARLRCGRSRNATFGATISALERAKASSSPVTESVWRAHPPGQRRFVAAEAVLDALRGTVRIDFERFRRDVDNC